MTTIRLGVLHPTGTATDARSTGSVEWVPSARRVVGADVVLPDAFRVALTTDADVTVVVAPTTTAWVWRVLERVSGGSGGWRYLAVPDSVTTVDYAALVEVDPATLDPIGPAPADVWALALAEAAEGLMGPAGADGATGATGAAGSAGATGAAGAAGTAGVVTAIAPATYDSGTVGVIVGTTAGTAAAGDDSRIAGALSAAVASATFARPVDVASLVNQRVVALGAHTDDADAAEPAVFNSAAGETPSYVLRFSNNTLPFDTAHTDAIHAAGQTPVISWMYGDGSSTLPNATYTLTRLLGGDFDAYMTTWLNAVKALGYTVYVAWSAEMNGDWQQYSEGVNGNTTGQYALAWKYVHNLAASLGVTNIKWVWEVTSKYASSTPLAGLYPGDAYVDVVAVNGYCWGNSQPGLWVDPPALYNSTLAEIATITTSKDIWIGEMGCAPDDGGSKTAWYAAFFAWLPTSLISAFIYYEKAGTPNWKVNSGTGTAAAFTAGMASLRTTTRATGPSVADPLRASIAAIGAAATASAAALYTPKGGPARGWKGSSFTLALADANTVVDCQASSTVTVTVPLNSVVAFPVGTVITLLQYDVGQVVVSPVSSGVTLRTNSGLATLSQWSVITLTKRGADEWIITQPDPAGTGAPLVEGVNTVATSGAAQTIPAVTTSTISRITLTAACTLTFPTAAAGKSFTLVLVQDGTGSRLVTWPASIIKWAAATAPTLSTGAGKIDYLTFLCVDGTNWAGFVSALDVR